MKANLVAVQAKTQRDDYRSAAAFQAKMAALMQAVARQADLALPTLVSFPELIGMFLSFVPFYWDDLKGASSLETAATAVVMKNLSRLDEAGRTSPEAAARRLLFIDTALDAEGAYVDTFSSLARECGVYLAAGSIALPPIEDEPSNGGRHVADPTKVYNTAYLFSPSGVCLSRVPKVNLTDSFESRVFDAAPKSELLPVETALGRVGTLVCKDGFYETLVERYDALGVGILLKPAYNQGRWNGPWAFGADRTEGEIWLTTGCPAIIQGRENIRYGVNAMLVGAVFEDMLSEGLSSI
ncbi:MAG TPA: carbon-nitrogen hydrolase family protein, partial [Dehalococcoidia bacterium]|nr:carbon-nitrogen hydrolase family protein [Dehalococcoidia bacterium]